MRKDKTERRSLKYIDCLMLTLILSFYVTVVGDNVEFSSAKF
jgi:hypothetical protein